MLSYLTEHRSFLDVHKIAVGQFYCSNHIFNWFGTVWQKSEL